MEEQKMEERRKEQGKKLKEIMLKKQEDKKIENENELAALKSIQSMKDAGDEENYLKQLKERKIKNSEECEQMIEDLEIKLKLKEKKILTDEEKYDLINIEDRLLTEE